MTVSGPELVGFASLGPTDHLKLYLPDPATGEHVVPDLRGGALRSLARRPPTVRDYTPRAYRPGTDGGELDIDFVLHDNGGPAASWAAGVQPGAPVAFGGPKGSRLVPDDISSVVVGGDETALPALARWLELLPLGVQVTVLAEVANAADEVYLAGVRSDAEIHWLHRDGRSPGTTMLLDEALRALPVPAPGTRVWFGAEAGSLIGVRRYLRRALGLTAAVAEVSGYWCAGVAAFDHHAPVDPGDPD